MFKFSLNFKFGALVVFLVGVCTWVAYTVIQGITKTRDRLEHVMEVNIPRDQLSADLLDDQRVITIYARDILLEDSLEKKKSLQKIYGDMVKTWHENAEKYDKMANDELRHINKKYKGQFEKWLELSARMQELSLSGKNKEATALLRGEMQTAITEARTLISDLRSLDAKRLKIRGEEADAIAGTSRASLIIVSAIAIGFGLILAIFMLYSLSRSINRIIDSLTESADQVTSAAQQIAMSSVDLSQASTEQAASLEETASSVSQMSSMVGRNTQSAKESSDLATQSERAAVNGKTTIGQMGRVIEEIAANNRQVVDALRVIAEIGEKTKIIHEIVFQTKLLSFNASVEAARAGEHGKGFAVVRPKSEALPK